MADPRFYERRGPFGLDELARLAEAELPAPAPALEIVDVAPLDLAGSGQITFLDNKKYLDQARRTVAAACLIRPQLAAALPDGVARLLTDDPYRGYARIAAAFYPEAAAPGSLRGSGAVAVTATVDPSARLGEGCELAPGAVIGAGAELGPGCRIGANAVIGKAVRLGADCRIGEGATLSHCLVGARVIIHPGVRIGQDGFGFALGAAGHAKVPQLGRVIIEDDVEIGANATIDRGSGPDTVIGQGCKIDNLVMIGHNVHLEAGCIVVAQSGISGSTRIGRGSILGAQVGVIGHLTIGAGVQLAARSAATRDLAAGGVYGGVPAVPIQTWRRQLAAISRLVKRKGGQA